MMHILKFTPTVGTHTDEFPFESPGTVKFIKAVDEVGKKLNLTREAIIISVPGGAALTSSEFNMTVDEIVTKYGERFQIGNRGIVG